MYGQTPANITFVALQQMNAAGEVVFENQKLYDFLKANSTPNPDNTGKDVLLFDFNDLTERYLIATGVVPGIITPPNGPAPNGSGGFTGVFPPVGEFIGQRWHRRATLSATPPKIGDLPTTLQWDGTAWVPPRFELLAKAFEHFTTDDGGTGKWQPIGCYLRSDEQWRAALEYNPDVEFYNKDQVVSKVVGGVKRWYRSKAADNETSPTQENSTIASAKWEWGLTEAEMCNLFNKSAASILDAVATFAESDYSLVISAAQIVARVEKLILAHAASNSEALARVTDQKFLTPANLPSLTATQAEVIEGKDAVKFVTPATLAGKAATDAEALTTPAAASDKIITVGNLPALKATDAQAIDKNDTQHLMTPHATDIAMANKFGDGVNKDAGTAKVDVGGKTYLGIAINHKTGSATSGAGTKADPLNVTMPDATTAVKGITRLNDLSKPADVNDCGSALTVCALNHVVAAAFPNAASDDDVAPAVPNPTLYIKCGQQFNADGTKIRFLKPDGTWTWWFNVPVNPALTPTPTPTPTMPPSGTIIASVTGTRCVRAPLSASGAIGLSGDVIVAGQVYNMRGAGAYTSYSIPVHLVNGEGSGISYCKPCSGQDSAVNMVITAIISNGTVTVTPQGECPPDESGNITVCTSSITLKVA